MKVFESLLFHTIMNELTSEKTFITYPTHLDHILTDCNSLDTPLQKKITQMSVILRYAVYKYWKSPSHH